MSQCGIFLILVFQEVSRRRGLDLLNRKSLQLIISFIRNARFGFRRIKKLHNDFNDFSAGKQAPDIHQVIDMRIYSTISETDIDSDFEYNFALSPFTQLLDGVHWLVTTPLIMVSSIMKLSTARFQTIREQQSYKRSFKGPVCMLK